jgi:diguanylate cyclase (GGDEF)-like protein
MQPTCRIQLVSLSLDSEFLNHDSAHGHARHVPSGNWTFDVALCGALEAHVREPGRPRASGENCAVTSAESPSAARADVPVPASVVLSALNVPAVVVDATGKVTAANREGRAVTGRRRIDVHDAGAVFAAGTAWLPTASAFGEHHLVVFEKADTTTAAPTSDGENAFDSTEALERLRSQVFNELQEAVVLWDVVTVDGTVTDLRVAHANKQALLLRIDPSTSIGSSIRDIVGDPASVLYIEEADRVHRTGETSTFDIDNIDEDIPGVGPWYLRQHSALLGTRLMTSIMDMTASVVTSRKAAREGARFRDTVDALSEGLFVGAPVPGTVPLDYQLTYVNRAGMAQLGIEPNDIDKVRLNATTAGTDIADRVRAATTSGDTVRFQVPVPGRDVVYEYVVTNVGGQVLVLVTDVSVQVRANERFRVTTETFNDPVILFRDENDSHVVVYANPAATRIGVDDTAFGRDIVEVLDDTTVASAATNTGKRAEVVEFRGRTWEITSGTAGRDCVAVFHDVTETVSETAHLLGLASTDPETGLMNRRVFDELLHAKLTSSEASIAVVVVDLGEVDLVTRSHGFMAADTLMTETASRLTASAHDADIVARVASTSFAVVMGDIRRVSELRARVEQIVSEVTTTAVVAGLRIPVRAVAGIAISPLHGSKAENLVRRAMAAAWQAWRMNQPAVVWTPALDAEVRGSVELLDELESALSDGALFVEYQPRHDLQTRKIVGAEAVVRWNHPVSGVIHAHQFEAALAASPLARPYTEWVIRHASSAWAKASQAGVPGRVSVNLPAAVVSDERIVESVSEALMAAGAGPETLDLEIAERDLSGSVVDVRDTLVALRSLGVELSVDDFGAGQASLAYLRRLPVSRVKLARGFIRNLNRDKVNQAIVQSCVKVADAVGLDVVAEGLETEAELETAVRLGCGYGQGFALGRPMPIDALIAAATDC